MADHIERTALPMKYGSRLRADASAPFARPFRAMECQYHFPSRQAQWRATAQVTEQGEALRDSHLQELAAALNQPTVQVTAQVTDQVEALRDSLLQELAAALDQPTMQVTMQVAVQVAGMLQLASVAEQSRDALQEVMGLADREHFRKHYLVPIMQGGWLVRTLDPPNHPQQRYRITDRGQVWIDRFNLLRTT